MKLSRYIVADAAMLMPLILAPLAAAEKLECGNIEADGVKFDFSKLKGPHSVITSEDTPPTVKNTTYTLDLCGSLKRKGKVDEVDRCPDGTWGESRNLRFPSPVPSCLEELFGELF